MLERLRPTITAITIAALLFPAQIVRAQEAAPAPPPAPTADDVLTQLLQLDPAQLAARVREMKAEAETLAAQSQQLRAQSGELDAQIAAFQTKLNPFVDIMKALAMAEGMVAPEVQAAAPAEGMAPEGMMAVENASAPVVTFADHVAPIFQARCVKCHDDDKMRGGLSLMTFDKAMAGGSSGKVLNPGQPDGSRLLRLIRQTEEPKMPPSGDPLTAAEIEVIRQWIAGGTLATAGSESMVMASAGPSSDAPAFVAAKIGDGPPPMPAVALASLNEKTERGVVARAIASSPIAPLLAVGGNNQILLYDLEKLTLIGALPYPEGDVYTMSFSANGEILLVGGGEEGDSGSVILWDVRTAARIGEFGKNFDTVLAADISPDHSMVAVGGPSRKVRVYSTKDAAELYVIETHTDWINSIKFSPDGELLASADRSGGLYLWQAANGRPVENLRGHNAGINDMAFSYDSAILATTGIEGNVILWDTWTNALIRSWGAHAGSAQSIDFSDAGQLVTAGIDRTAKRWDINGTALTTYPALADWAYQTRFGAKDSLVVAGCWTGAIGVWKAETAEQVAEFTTNPAPDLVLAAQPAAAPAAGQ